MTPALQTIVDAMIAEIRRQGDLPNLIAAPKIDTTPLPGPAHAALVYIDGAVDLEMVARAALEAGPVADALEECFFAGGELADAHEGKRREPDDPPGPTQAARAALDAILGESP